MSRKARNLFCFQAPGIPANRKRDFTCVDEVRISAPSGNFIIDDVLIFAPSACPGPNTAPDVDLNGAIVPGCGRGPNQISDDGANVTEME